MIYADIGTISHGTLLTRDLMETFSDELARLVRRNRDYLDGRDEVQYQRLISDALDDLDAEQDDELASELVTELVDALNEFAPPYCYFGTLEGDGADFGFWPDLEGAKEFVDLTVNDTGDVPEDFTGEVIHVNDHGNVTLYVATNGELEEIWAIV